MTTREQDVRLADGRVLRVLDTRPAKGEADRHIPSAVPAARVRPGGWVAPVGVGGTAIRSRGALAVCALAPQ
jgi:hypothetical protein